MINNHKIDKIDRPNSL